MTREDEENFSDHLELPNISIEGAQARAGCENDGEDEGIGTRDVYGGTRRRRVDDASGAGKLSFAEHLLEALLEFMSFLLPQLSV